MSFRLDDILGSKVTYSLSLSPRLIDHPFSPVDRNVVEVGMDIGVGA